MMQRPSLLWSSILLYPSHTALCTFRRLTLPLGPQLVCDAAASSSLQFSLTRLRNYRHAIPPLHSTGTRETVETTKTGTEFVEVGYLSSAHGLHGEICVKPSTDFPELRFSKPGRRWLKQLVSGKETIQEVQLVEGRGHPGQKSWILKFEGVDVVDQETGEPLGTVVNVFNYGASDILRVMLDSSVDKPEKNLKSTPRETDISGRLVWVPFVEAIVPDVDMIRRELQITPPKGLLELNFRSDDRSKKERRQIEWKERKRSQRRLIAAKKKLSEMEQQHVFHGFRFGEKMQRSLLADQIVGVNSKLLQQALKSVTMSTERLTDTEIFSATKTKLVSNTIKISKDFLTTYSSEKESAVNFNYKEKGISLMSKGKVASILFVQDIERWRCSELDHVDSDCVDSSSFSVLQSLLSDNQRFVKVEDHVSMPLILLCPSDKVQSLEKLLSDNDYFAFDSEKVWVLEEEKLPVISSSPEEQNKHKILMKSPWEILQSPVGSGGVISLLATQNILENLTEIGVQYVEICSTSQEYASGSPMLLGLANSCEADVGIQIVEDAKDLEENLRTVFSMNFMKKLTNHVEKLQFYAVPKSSSYVEMVDKEWIDVTPSSTNSFELRCSIYSALNACSLDKMCVMEVTE
ncbi:uncharacterized protein LOC120005208 isoform X2 [Tripterygium wilfordii]|uniref:uncharacterized protein LOC120005208 isoform X2 n=1 Tax=Tripterygium wilfordii TaxID=458696 RepID=UPI0018F83836|nr:uncharacterized protein LOC120005208 isoform X2 [Tripterygium wilfordii]